MYNLLSTTVSKDICVNLMCVIVFVICGGAITQRQKNVNVYLPLLALMYFDYLSYHVDSPSSDLLITLLMLFAS